MSVNWSRMRILPRLVSCLLCSVSLGWTLPRPQAATQAPNLGQAAQHRIKEFIEVMNTGDTSRVREYVTNNFAKSFLEAIPLEDHIKIISMGYQESGGYDLQRMVPHQKNAAMGLMQTRRTKEWMRIMLVIEGEPPYRIASIGIMPSGPMLPEIPAGPLTDSQIIEHLKKYLEQASAAEQFSGAVLIAKDGKPLYKAAYGLACRSFNAPNRVDTKFNLGSMNKMFTAVAIAQLAEKGKLSFDDPISKYLTDWLPEAIARKVTIHHLLTHTSGLGSYFNEKFMKSLRELYRKIDDYKPLVADEKLEFEPGTKWSYSNTGFLLLGAVIEKVTGQSYFDYVRENIYKPANMINTDCYEMDDVVPNLAIGYAHPQGKWKNNLFMHVIKGGPAGGGFSTVEDLLNFDIALRNHKLLSPEYTRLVLSAKPERNSPRYGYGFGVEENPRAVGHSGGFPGISSNLLMFLDSGYTLAVLSNVDAGSFDVVELFKGMLQAQIKQQQKSDKWEQAVPPPPAP
jgi:CubicO group peptidase (beta-lactamase class C family)